METALYAFLNSDGVGKGIVLLLIVFSCVVWSIFIVKYLYIRHIGRANKAFAQFRQKCRRNPLSIAGVLERTNTRGPLFDVCRAGVDSLREILDLQEGIQGFELERSGVIPRELTDRELDQIYAAMSRAVNDQQEEIEDNLSMLGTLGSLAPMLGLFGTVWGVMATFVGIVAAGGRPDIQHIAPGISGALLTTVLGLFVAIPVIALSNYCNGCVNQICTEMDNFTQEFLASVSTARTSEPIAVQRPSAPGMTQAAAGQQQAAVTRLGSPFDHGAGGL